ncbi:hypothetical protein [Prevotella falsenii]
MIYIDIFDGQRYNNCAIIVLCKPFFFAAMRLRSSRNFVEAEAKLLLTSMLEFLEILGKLDFLAPPAIPSLLKHKKHDAPTLWHIVRKLLFYRYLG